MTQHERIIDYLDHYGSITPMEAFMYLGITKLATRISEMTAEGMEFEKERIKTKTLYGEPVTYMKYSRK